jgi:hypothetical protein
MPFWIFKIQWQFSVLRNWRVLYETHQNSLRLMIFPRPVTSGVRAGLCAHRHSGSGSCCSIAHISGRRNRSSARCKTARAIVIDSFADDRDEFYPYHSPRTGSLHHSGEQPRRCAVSTRCLRARQHLGQVPHPGRAALTLLHSKRSARASRADRLCPQIAPFVDCPLHVATRPQCAVEHLTHDNFIRFYPSCIAGRYETMGDRGKKLSDAHCPVIESFLET